MMNGFRPPRPPPRAAGRELNLLMTRNFDKPNDTLPDFAVRDTWRSFRIMAEFVEGFETLSAMPRAVTVFGSARCQPDSPEFLEAEAMGRGLARAGYAVITGGGPGVMEAANKGALEAGGESV